MKLIDKGGGYASKANLLKMNGFYCCIVCVDSSSDCVFPAAGHSLNKAPENFFELFEKKGSIEFFLFATIVGWMIAVAAVVIFVVGIHEKISALPWPLVVRNAGHSIFCKETE